MQEVSIDPMDLQLAAMTKALFDIRFIPVGDESKCPECSADYPDYGRHTNPMWGPWGGCVECKSCGYRQSFASHIAQNMITVVPMEDENVQNTNGSC